MLFIEWIFVASNALSLIHAVYMGAVWGHAKLRILSIFVGNIVCYIFLYFGENISMGIYFWINFTSN